jgi:hypothetical protein
MADKQAILALAVPDLVEGLVNPRCIDPTGVAEPQSVPSPTDDCPSGLKREFESVLDIHIGVISSSLGGHGADTCRADGTEPSNNDKGRLLSRSNEHSADNDIPTYQDLGFLAWDPKQKLDGTPDQPSAQDGEADIRTDSDKDLNMDALVPTLTEMVKGVGQSGCGFEAQMESWYRFLVDPAPYESISSPDDKVTVPTGTDQTVLKQRTDFLRPNSLLAIVLLSDENDCSIR